MERAPRAHTRHANVCIQIHVIFNSRVCKVGSSETSADASSFEESLVNQRAESQHARQPTGPHIKPRDSRAKSNRGCGVVWCGFWMYRTMNSDISCPNLETAILLPPPMSPQAQTHQRPLHQCCPSIQPDLPVGIRAESGTAAQHAEKQLV